MRDAGRLAAAIEVLSDLESRHKPVRMALKNWGEASRFAGSKDRAFVSGLVLDALRRRRSLTWMIGEDSPRAAVLGALRYAWDWPVERIAEAAGEEPHGPGALIEAEIAALTTPRALDDAPAPVRGDYPDWLEAAMTRVFGEARAQEAQALARRAPIDLRVNTLKSDVPRTIKALASVGAEPAGLMAEALRIAAPEASERAGSAESEPAFAKGWFEVQDLGSQIAAAAAGAIAGKQVLDLCAGGGGKTLALAAAMGPTGQIYAYDSEARRLADTVTRSQRAGVRNLQVRSPSDPKALAGLDGRMDVVFVDAPCTGSGAWRRHPDAKWRLGEEQLQRRLDDQDAVLSEAAVYVKTGGRVVYVTCSLFAEENEDRVAAFLAGHPHFAAANSLDAIAASGRAAPEGVEALSKFQTREGFLRLTPRTAGTDGFFVAVLERRS